MTKPTPEGTPEDATHHDDDDTAPRASSEARDRIIKGIVQRAGERGGGRGLAEALERKQDQQDT